MKSIDIPAATETVRAAAVKFAANNPRAKRAEIAKYLQGEGFGSSSYPISSWVKEAQDVEIALGVNEDDDSPATFPVHGVPADPVIVPAAKVKKAKVAPAWKSGTDSEKLDYLLAHQTIPDRNHTDIPRLDKESRKAFLVRIYG